MNTFYHDIIDKLGKPEWFDEHAVPRYLPFAPDLVANIYAADCALIVVECQNCGREFRVAMSASVFDGTRLDVAALHYGDPPNVQCCASGPTMNSVPRRVLEFWRRRRFLAGGVDDDHDTPLEPFERVSSFDGADITPKWATEGP